jgi:Asparagine synthase (glutamine-hydrolyzing)
MLYERFHKILGIRTRVEMKTEIIEEMEKILKNFLERFGDHALLFSGGLDSSIIAWLLKQAGKETKLYTLCYNDESYDIIQSGKSAKLIGLKVKKVKFDENDVIEGAKLVKKILKTRVTSIDVSHFILAKNVEENTVISGQGADELFCGYAKYTKMDKNEREKGMREDFKNWVRTKKEAKIFGHFEKRSFSLC